MENHPLFVPWVPLVLLFLSILYFFLLKQRNRGGKIANLPPSPPMLPFIGNIHQLGQLPHQSLWKLSQKYGPIMLLKLGQVPTLVISSSEMAKQVLRTHDHNCGTRPHVEGSRKFTYNFSGLAFTPTNSHWKELRKICVAELFSARRVRSFQLQRKQEMTNFIKLISKGSQNPLNLSEKVFSFNEGMVCKVAYGRKYGERRFESFELEDALHEAMTVLASFSAADIFPLFGWIWDFFSGLHKRQEKCFHELDLFCQRVLDDHLDPTRTLADHHEDDVIDALIKSSKGEVKDGFMFTQDAIKATIMDIFLAGVDTSSITIVWAITELAKNPKLMKKLQSEIRSCVGIDKPMVEESDIENLHYLKSVVKETLRLHPPTVLLLPRETTSHCEIGGYDVHPNTRIQVNVWAMGRDPKIWNVPEEFIPERFDDNALDYKGQHFEFVPFGGGKRMCPGLIMGITSVEFVLANLLYCFDWKLPDGMRTEDISLEEGGVLTVYKKLPLYLVPIKYNFED